MKKRLFFTGLFLIVCFFCGCTQGKYELSGSVQDIEKLEIIHISPYDVASTEELLNSEPYAIVPNEEIPKFLNELFEVPHHWVFMDPCDIIIGYTARIQYQDGSVELISSKVGKYIDDEKEDWKYFLFEEQEFNAVIQCRLNIAGNSSVS